MRLRTFTVLLCLFVLLKGHAPAQGKVGVSAVQYAYEQFDYAQTVTLARAALGGPDSLSQPEKITVVTLKGVAEYSLGREDNARATFMSLLTLDAKTTLDPVAYSPKIIEFFDQVKRQFVPAPVSTTKVQESDKNRNREEETFGPIQSGPTPGMLAKSIVLPGWGQLSSDAPGSATKGWIFATAAVGTIAASVYYIIQTNNLQSDYLGARDRVTIASAYDEYSSAYTKRTISIVAFAAVWTAAQVDLLYLNPAQHPGTTGLSFHTGLETRNAGFGPSFSVQYSF